MTIKRQILAMGGGGFSMEPHNSLLDRYLLSICKKDHPKVCFIGTASGDDLGYRDKFYSAFELFPCETNHISLSEIDTENLEQFVNEQDVFYVGGGNTVILLNKWRESGLDRYLKSAYDNGVIMAGLSAGSICWFEEGLSDSLTAGSFEPLKCLGWLEGSHCPHFDGEAERQEIYKNLVIDSKMKEGWALDDGCALHVIDEEVFRIVSSHPDKKAYKYSNSIEHPNQLGIDSGYLGGSSIVIRPAAKAELPSILDQHREELEKRPDASPVLEAFVLEVYGSIKAHATVEFQSANDSEIGKQVNYHCDDSISGKSIEANFRSALAKISRNDFV